MKILNTRQIKRIDQATIDSQNISSISLMERASTAFTKLFTELIKKDTSILLFCGPGNNGGDGLGIASQLLLHNHQVAVYIVHSEKYSSENLFYQNILKDRFTIIRSEADFPKLSDNHVVIDALFGAGLNKQLTGILADLVEFLNNSCLPIFSVDVPSGLNTDQQSDGDIIIQATATITFHQPKLAFMLPQNFKYVGNLYIVDIGLDKQSLSELAAEYFYVDKEFIGPLLKKRLKQAHKGDFGKALLIAGSYGMMGAAILSVKACCRAGAGLVTAYIPTVGYGLLQTSIPEAIVICDPEADHHTQLPTLEKYNAIGIGSGMKENTFTYSILKELFLQSKLPIVVDAGALNVISQNPELLKLIPKNSILTPHPGEFIRLCGKQDNELDRLETLKQFSQTTGCIVVLKGAHTAIAVPDGKVYFNSTGNPGMAKGGSGDVLTGIITALIAQSYTPFEAAVLGVYLHGYAGDQAASTFGENSLLPSDIIESIGMFFKDFAS